MDCEKQFSNTMCAGGVAYARDKNTSARLCTNNAGGDLCARWGGGGGGGICGTTAATKAGVRLWESGYGLSTAVKTQLQMCKCNENY